MKIFLKIITLLIISQLVGCDNNQVLDKQYLPVDVKAGDECHLCGMYVSRFAGPKGQAYLRRQKSPRHFCSTRDLFAYLLQPDVVPNIAQVFVHDMGKTNWNKPEHSAAMYIDASTAYYVIGHTQTGAMGHTLASFSDRQASEGFVKQYGGQILRYQDVTLQIINQLN